MKTTLDILKPFIDLIALLAPPAIVIWCICLSQQRHNQAKKERGKGQGG